MKYQYLPARKQKTAKNQNLTNLNNKTKMKIKTHKIIM